MNKKYECDNDGCNLNGWCPECTETIVQVLDTQFEEGKPCINPITDELVSDSEYDELKKRLEGFKESHKPSLSTVEVLDKVVHDPPMVSINKCSGTVVEKEELLYKWLEMVGTKNIVQSLKLDGIAVSLKYENGVLVAAGLRSGDGTYGENVLPICWWVDDIPLKLNTNITCDIRGELYCRLSDFDKVNKYLASLGEEPRANARNHTAGAARKDYSKQNDAKQRTRLSFTAYDIIVPGVDIVDEMEKAQLVNGLTIPFVALELFLESNVEEGESFDYWDKEHRKLDYLVDGIVLTVNNCDKREALGKHGNSPTGNPKGRIAWKFSDETAEVVVKNIAWQTGRTGNITPVLEFDPVLLEGTMVGRCTAHNYGMIKEHSITIGSKIRIKKSGKIIPKFIEVVEHSYVATVYPNICPSCGQCAEVDINNVHLICQGQDCPAQNVKKFYHYLDTIGVKGIGESLIEKLTEAKLVSMLYDLYKLTPIMLIEAGFTKRTAYLTVARIWMVKNPEKVKDIEELWKLTTKQGFDNGMLSVPAGKLFAAFGISEAGKEVGRIIETNFDKFTDIFKLTEKDWQKFDGIGEVTAEYIKEWSYINSGWVFVLLQFIQPTFKKKVKSNISNKTFCFTGGFEGGKKKWQGLVEEKGGVVKGSVSKKLDYVIVGESAGSKEQKAKDLGITMLNLEELKILLDV